MAGSRCGAYRQVRFAYSDASNARLASTVTVESHDLQAQDCWRRGGGHPPSKKVAADIQVDVFRADDAGGRPAPEQRRRHRGASGPGPLCRSRCRCDRRGMLIEDGLIDDIEAFIEAIPTRPSSAEPAPWEYSGAVQRHFGLVVADRRCTRVERRHDRRPVRPRFDEVTLCGGSAVRSICSSPLDQLINAVFGGWSGDHEQPRLSTGATRSHGATCLSRRTTLCLRGRPGDLNHCERAYVEGSATGFTAAGNEGTHVSA